MLAYWKSNVIGIYVMSLLVVSFEDLDPIFHRPSAEISTAHTNVDNLDIQ